MFDTLKTAINDIFTGIDGKSYDVGRFSWVGSFGVVGLTALVNAWHGVAVNLMELGGALSAVAAAHGIALGAKSKTEPGENA